MSRFQPGQTIVMRDLQGGRIREVRPEIVIRDEPGLTAFWSPAGTIHRKAVNGFPSVINDNHETRYEESHLDSWKIVRLAVPGEWYSVLLFFHAATGSMSHWYINLEEPLQRTCFGFDYADLFLDIIAAPDLSVWHWEDEDELEEAVSRGLVSPERSEFLYREGTKAIEWLISGNSSFNGWEDWQPDPAWSIPVFPDGWDTHTE